MAVTSTQLNQLYLAYFGRPVDFGGSIYFTNPALNASVSDVAAAFASSAESQALYGPMTNPTQVASAVNAIYMNLFNRGAELAGLTYWTQLISSGQISAPQAALQIMAGAQGTDATSISNKLAASQAFFNVIQTDTSGTDALGYAGTAAAAAARTWLTTVTSDATTLTNATANISATVTSVVQVGMNALGQTITLTTGIDNVTGTAYNDTFNAILNGGAAGQTLTPLDNINGAGGTNSLNISDLATAGSTIPGGVTIQNIQTVNWAAAGAVNADVSAVSGLWNFNVTQSAGTDFVKAAGTTTVSVVDSGAGNVVTVDGGNNVSVNSADAVNVGYTALGVADVAPKGAVTVTTTGASVQVNGGTSQTVTVAGGVTLAKATGAITVTETAHTAAAGSNSTIDGGTSVTVTDTATLATATANGTVDTITIGATTQPTGAVAVTENVTGDKTGNATAGAISIKGGTTVNVTENATQPIATPSTTAGATTTDYTVTQSAVSVTGGAATTAVAVTQTPAVAKVDSVTAKAGANETDVFSFTALAAAGTATVGGLQFTATAAMTAAQVAAAFANLSSGAIQGSSTLGTYLGVFASGWSTGAVSATSTVTATNATATTAAGPTLTAAGGATVAAGTAGVTAVAAVTGVGGIADSAVTIADKTAGTGAGTINYVQLSGYATGSTIASDALATLSLANGAGSVSVSDKGATALALTVNNLAAGSTLNLDAAAATYKTLNITTAGADSAENVTAAAVTALTVAGTNGIDLSGSTLTALKTVTVSGAASVKVDVSADASMTDVNASATSGAMKVTIDATKATYEGGSGNDSVTVIGNVSKAISLGAGTNTLTLSSATAAVTAAINGGSGSADTLVMDSALAATDSGSTTFASSVTGFEHLTVTGATAAPVIDVAKLGGYTYVTDAGTADSLTVLNLGSGGTLVLSGASAHTDTVDASAASTASNSLNVVLTNAGATAATDSVTTTANANVTTVNITATDTTTGVKAGATADSLALTDAAATTITVTGNAHLTLTGANTSVSVVDASGMTGGLSYQAAGVVAETVKGGASANTLTASTGTVTDTLIGGAGNDKLVANAGMDTLTGGAGADTFVIQTPSANLNSYATVTDATVGDTIQFVAGLGDTFIQSKVSLASTAVFQDYANAVVSNVAKTAGSIAWFQYGGDTYVIQNETGTETSFNNGHDLVVKLAGLVDLSHTSLSTANGTLLIG